MELYIQDGSPTVIGHTVDSFMCNNILAYSRLLGLPTLSQLVQNRGWSLQPAPRLEPTTGSSWAVANAPCDLSLLVNGFFISAYIAAFC